MPIYEYECDACGNRFELIQKFSDEPIEVCPKCGERKVHKRVSSPAFHLKGSGWYLTDYARKGGNAGETKSEDKGSSDKGDKSEKSDKPADKSAKSEKTEKPASTSASTPASTPSTSSSTDKSS